jgi:glycosyltransferase involved in cell wall biosynthesis
MKIVVVEPLAHLIGHYPVEARRLAQAMIGQGHEVSVVTSFGFRAVPGLDDIVADQQMRVVDNGRTWQRLALRSLPGIWFKTGGGRLTAFAQAILTWFTLGLANRVAQRQGADAALLVSGSFFAFLAFAASPKGFVITYILRYMPRAVGVDGRTLFRHRLQNVLVERGLRANAGNLCFTHIGAGIFEAFDRAGFAADSHEVVPIGIRTHATLMGRDAARESLGLERDARILLVFGSGHAGKNFHTIFEALRQTDPAVKVLFAGKRVPMNDPHGLARNHDLVDRVVVVDAFIPEADLEQYFRAADGLLMSYAGGFLAHSGVLALAAEYDLPVVASDAGEIGKAVRRWNLGVTFEPGNPDALARAIATFLALDGRKRAELTANLGTFRDAHSWASVADAYVEVFETARARFGRDREVRPNVQNPTDADPRTGTETPTFSVLMPAYNVASYIGEAVDSVLAQTCPDWELIIVDDGSTDSIVAALEHYDDPRLRVVRRPHEGVAAARAHAVGLARGAIIVFLDADDRLRRSSLARFRRALEAHPDAGVAYGNRVFLDERGAVLDRWDRFLFSRRPQGDLLERALIASPIPTSGQAAIRRALLEQAGGWPVVPGGADDWCFWAVVTSLTRFATVGRAPVLEYRLRPGSIARSYKSMGPGDTDDIGAEQFAHALDHIYRDPRVTAAVPAARLQTLRRRAEAQIYRIRGYEVLRRREWAAARRLLWRGVRMHPFSIAAVLCLLFATFHWLPRWTRPFIGQS